jgi:hypothetical protein
MKKQSKTTTVLRINLEDGKYTTISRQVLMNPNLRDSSKTLLQLILNNKDGWKLVLSYYQKRLQWCNDKMAGAVRDLIKNGYLKKDKHPNGNDKGFTYTYIISEFGNLNPNNEDVNEVEILAEVIASSESEDAIPQESNQQPLEVKEIPLKHEQIQLQPTADIPFRFDMEFLKKVFDDVEEALSGELNLEFSRKVYTYYKEQVKTGKLLSENYNEKAIKSIIQERKTKFRNALNKELNDWMDLHNDTGTKDQRANIKAKALIHFNDLLKNGTVITEKMVSDKILKLKVSVVYANRVYDSRYQD